MTDSSTINPLLGGLQPRNTPSSQPAKDEKAIGQDEFLTMLVAQLKNQDPLNPMQNEQFAVDLAQFSQLERLVSIDQKLGAQQTDVSSYAAYLGREVTYKAEQISVEDGSGGALSLTLPSPVSDVSVELVDGLGRTVHQIDAGNLNAGTQRVSLEDLPLPNGDYSVRATGTGLSGERVTLATSAVSVVTGFVPGPTPALLVGNREISPGDIERVTTV
jgi:flagellar basal-body rod modification protein FlgD